MGHPRLSGPPAEGPARESGFCFGRRQQHSIAHFAIEWGYDAKYAKEMSQP
jgi:hypothetical protein